MFVHPSFFIFFQSSQKFTAPFLSPSGIIGEWANIGSDVHEIKIHFPYPPGVKHRTLEIEESLIQEAKFLVEKRVCAYFRPFYLILLVPFTTSQHLDKSRVMDVFLIHD